MSTAIEGRLFICNHGIWKKAKKVCPVAPDLQGMSAAASCNGQQLRSVLLLTKFIIRYTLPLELCS